MDWEAKERERQREIDQERSRLLAMSDSEAEKLPTPDRYQRIRYLREIEAHKWLMEERRKLPLTTDDKPVSTKRWYGKPKLVYDRD